MKFCIEKKLCRNIEYIYFMILLFVGLISFNNISF